MFKVFVNILNIYFTLSGLFINLGEIEIEKLKIVGENIKRIRTARGYSLRDLAAKVNASASFISQVEMGKISPSLAKLKDISDALNTTVGLLIGETVPHSDSRVVKKGNRRKVDHMGTGVNVSLLSIPDPFKQMEPLIFELEEGASSGEKSFQHFGQEFVLIMKGRLTFFLNDKNYELVEGDSFYFNSSTPHSFRNSGKGKALALWVITPPSF
jgi:transcriptional regulator with XRE-family HTH domain